VIFQGETSISRYFPWRLRLPANSHLSEQCWFAIHCMSARFLFTECSNFFEHPTNVCPVGEDIIFPRKPVVAGHNRFGFSSGRTSRDVSPIPDYICFDPEKTPPINITWIINGLTCIHRRALKIRSFSRSLLPIHKAMRGNSTTFPRRLRQKGTRVQN
jgi:hypothetical protein